MSVDQERGEPVLGLTPGEPMVVEKDQRDHQANHGEDATKNHRPPRGNTFPRDQRGLAWLIGVVRHRLARSFGILLGQPQAEAARPTRTLD